MRGEGLSTTCFCFSKKIVPRDLPIMSSSSNNTPFVHQYLLLPNGEARIQLLKNLADGTVEDKKRKEMASPAPVNSDKKRMKTPQLQEKPKILEEEEEEESSTPTASTPDVFSLSSQQHPFDKKVVSLKKLESKKKFISNLSEQQEKDLDKIQVSEQQREHFDHIYSQRINLQANIQDAEEDFDLGL